MTMNKIECLLVISTLLISLNGCTSFDEQVKDYAAVKQNIDLIYDDISAGRKTQEVGVAEISELNEELESFDPEVVQQFYKEEEIRKEIERKNRKYKEQFRRDSIEQARIDQREAHELKMLEAKKAREEEARLKAEELQQRKEVAAMIAAEEEADRNAYIKELKEKGFFLVEFDGETYEVNHKEWNEWKESQDYDSAGGFEKYKVMFASMGYEKANELANSLYRTVSKKIAMEGITYKAIEGIKVYNLLTTGETKFE